MLPSALNTLTPSVSASGKRSLSALFIAPAGCTRLDLDDDLATVAQKFQKKPQYDFKSSA